MVKKVWNRILCTLIICLSLCIGGHSEAEAAAADYVVTPILTDGDSEGGESYFDLTIEPSRKQTFGVEVQNNTEQEAIVYTGMYTTVIGEGGAVEHLGPEELTDEPYIRLSELISGESEIVIPAGKSYVFQFTVAMPPEGLEVPVSGDLVFVVSAEAQENVMSRDLVELIGSDLYSYTVPISLTAGENAVIPTLTLKEILVEDGAESVKAIIQNATSISADNVSIEATVSKKGKKTVLFESSQTDIKISDHSDYEFPIISKGKKVEAGEYTLHMDVSIGSSQWQWDKDFTIKDETADNTEADNTEAAHQDQGETAASGNFSWVIVLLVILMFAGIVVCLLLYRKKQKEEEAIIGVIKKMLSTL